MPSTKTIPANLAPIGLSAYSRVGHLRRTVDSLRANPLARHSELFIFSDAPRQGDEEKVAAVREYLPTIDGFKSIEIFERAENNRVANNRGGIRMLLERYGRTIFVEEDAICAPNFLDYMNDALEIYGEDPRVFAVSGYFPPIVIPASYPHDVVMSPRMNAWTFGIWKDRYDSIEMGSRPEMFEEIFEQGANFRRYSRGGYAVIPQLQALSEGRVDGLDIRIDYTLFRHGRYVICPARSLVKPTGCDGSGEHWKQVSNRHDIDIEAAPSFVRVTADVTPSDEIIGRLRRFHNRALPASLLLIMNLHRFGCYQPLRWLMRQWRALRPVG